MSGFRIAKLEALLARVLERRDEPRAVAALVELGAAAPASVQPGAATTPPPPPVDVPAVSIPRQPALAVSPTVIEAEAPEIDELESTHVSRASGPALVPSAAQSHSRIATAGRSTELEAPAELEEEAAPVSSERTVDPSFEADADSAKAPPESTRQLATNPPPQSVPPRTSTAPASFAPAQMAPVSVAPAPVSIAPESAPRSVGNPVITRGSLPPDANDAVEYRGELPVARALRVGDLLDATLLL